VPEVIYHELLKLIDGLEKRIASLEPKPSEEPLNRITNDFDGADATKVPTGENESNTERLKAKEIIVDFYNDLKSQQKDISPEFEETFRKHHKDLFAKF
jgi:hypothetical protein